MNIFTDCNTQEDLLKNAHETWDACHPTWLEHALKRCAEIARAEALKEAARHLEELGDNRDAPAIIRALQKTGGA